MMKDMFGINCTGTTFGITRTGATLGIYSHRATPCVSILRWAKDEPEEVTKKVSGDGERKWSRCDHYLRTGK